MTPRLFLLSPANCGGSRARQLLAPSAASALATRLRSPEGAPLGDVFAFVSGLYFRGKLAYARRFAAPPAGAGSIVGTGVHVITATDGLVPPDRPITVDSLTRYAGQGIVADNPAFTHPLTAGAVALRDAIPAACDVVLLGSIASPKYVDVLVEVFGDQLRFPLAFVGRGDMSRGGLLLRQVAEGVELDYGLVRGSVRRGPRPPKLPSLTKRVTGSGDPEP